MTDTAFTIAAGPIIETFRPIIAAAVTAIVGVAVTFGVRVAEKMDRRDVAIRPMSNFASSSSANRSGDSDSRGN